MKTYFLDDLLSAISAAIGRVNQTLQQQQSNEYVSQMFEANKQGALLPRVRRMVLPRQHIQPGEEAEGVHEVPDAVLCNHDRLTIDNLVMEFDCLIEGLEGDEQSGGPRLSLLLGSSIPNRVTPGRLRITFKQTNPPEGVAEVNDTLLKKF